MNYVRVIKYAISFYLLWIMTSTVLAMLFVDDLENTARTYIGLSYLLSFILGILVYALVGYRETAKPYVYSSMVAFTMWCVDAPLSLMIKGHFEIAFDPVTFVIPIIFAIGAVATGTTIGIKVRNCSKQRNITSG
ncbi:hypothetical protein [Microbulbifer variabilis]|uniref:hypothetical protein n=1 Tax=Microbulbifer variabilis TaxID=266805 RepID=UPI0003683116|nr:hypothetical protein [Microbulbifer variabilis]